MEKVKQTTLVLGEGITEFFFLDSLKDEYRALRQVKPSCPRNSSLEDLGDGFSDLKVQSVAVQSCFTNNRSL